MNFSPKMNIQDLGNQSAGMLCIIGLLYITTGYAYPQTCSDLSVSVS